MKKLLLLVAAIAGIGSFKASAAISVTPGGGGTNICANRAVGGVLAGFTTLGNITITEGNPTDITNGFHGLVLNAPPGWQFNTAAVPTFGFTGSDIVAVNSGGISATTVTVNILSFGSANINTITIIGLQVQATGAGSPAGAIRPSAAPGLTGITTGGGGTIFANLSLQATVTPSVTIAKNPAGNICPGTTVTFTATPANGGVPTYQWRLNGTPVAGATNTTWVTNTLTNGNTVSVLMNATGCVSPLAATSNTITVTVETPPNVDVTGEGTFCSSTTINAALLGTGTVYYQGVRYNGTSVATPSTSQVITNSGTHTFYFRAASPAGCWGLQDSATVTINMPPTGIAITPATTAICNGDSTMLVASATPSDIEVMHEDFNSGAPGWAITNLSGTANSYFQIRRSPGYNGTTPGDGSPYMQAAPDATGAGITTTTMVQSPAFSLVGYTAATLSFNQYIPTWAGDSSVVVEYSTDGITWSTFFDQTGLPGGGPSWLSTTPSTTVALPAGAIGMPSVQLRWYLKSTWGFYWAIDNIAVNATPQLTFDWAGPGALSCTTCDTVMVTPSAIGANVYTVSSTVAGCTVNTTATVTLNALPTVFNVTGGGAYCAGGTGLNVLLSGSEAGVDYALYNGATPVTTLPGTGSGLDFGPQTAAGAYYVYATNTTTSCMATMADSAVIVINPTPAPITGPSSVCAGSTITLVETSTGGTWSSSDITVATVDTTGVVTGVAGGTVDISYAFATGCNATYAITVNALPVVAPITGAANVCVGGTTTLANATPGGIWTSSATATATIDATGLVTGVAPGTSAISYTVTDGFGCATTVTMNETVSAPPASTILPVGPNVTMCHGNPVNLVGTTIPGATYQWSLGGTAITGATNASYIASTAGNYTLEINNSVCIWTLPSRTVLNAPNAVATYNTTGNYLYTGSFNSYQWFRNGVAVSGANSSILMSPTDGDYMVVVTDITGCTDTSNTVTIGTTGITTPATQTMISVYPNPTTSVLHIDAPVAVHAVVLAADGRVALTANGNEVNVSNLAKGMYLIRIYNEQNVLLGTARFSRMD